MTFDAFKDRVFQQAKAAGLEEFELYYTDGEKFAVTVFEGEVESTDISKTAGVVSAPNGREVWAPALQRRWMSAPPETGDPRDGERTAQTRGRRGVLPAGRGGLCPLARAGQGLQAITASQKIELAQSLSAG